MQKKYGELRVGTTLHVVCYVGKKELFSLSTKRKKSPAEKGGLPSAPFGGGEEKGWSLIVCTGNQRQASGENPREYHIPSRKREKEKACFFREGGGERSQEGEKVSIFGKIPLSKCHVILQQKSSGGKKAPPRPSPKNANG